MKMEVDRGSGACGLGSCQSFGVELSRTLARSRRWGWGGARCQALATSAGRQEEDDRRRKKI